MCVGEGLGVHDPSLHATTFMTAAMVMITASGVADHENDVFFLTAQEVQYHMYKGGITSITHPGLNLLIPLRFMRTFLAA